MSSQIQTKRGPKTQRGKRHSSQNARRHGLSLPITRDVHYAHRIDQVARAILGDISRSDLLPLARDVAEAILSIERIRNIEKADLKRIGRPDRSEFLRAKRDNVPAHHHRYILRAYGRLRSRVRRLDLALSSSATSLRDSIMRLSIEGDENPRHNHRDGVNRNSET